jgi:hypothetical protein
MTASILSTTHNGDPAFGLKQRTLARKRTFIGALVFLKPGEALELTVRSGEGLGGYC